VRLRRLDSSPRGPFAQGEPSDRRAAFVPGVRERAGEDRGSPRSDLLPPREPLGREGSSGRPGPAGRRSPLRNTVRVHSHVPPRRLSPGTTTPFHPDFRDGRSRVAGRRRESDADAGTVFHPDRVGGKVESGKDFGPRRPPGRRQRRLGAIPARQPGSHRAADARRSRHRGVLAEHRREPLPSLSSRQGEFTTGSESVPEPPHVSRPPQRASRNRRLARTLDRRSRRPGDLEGLLSAIGIDSSRLRWRPTGSGACPWSRR